MAMLPFMQDKHQIFLTATFGLGDTLLLFTVRYPHRKPQHILHLGFRSTNVNTPNLAAAAAAAALLD